MRPRASNLRSAAFEEWDCVWLNRVLPFRMPFIPDQNSCAPGVYRFRRDGAALIISSAIFCEKVSDHREDLLDHPVHKMTFGPLQPGLERV